jgi:hypothetical protein
MKPVARLGLCDQGRQMNEEHYRSELPKEWVHGEVFVWSCIVDRKMPKTYVREGGRTI